MSIPATPQVDLLRSLGIRPKQVQEFAEMDMTTLETVVADARQRTGIRDIGGWVVSILRDIQDYGWEPAAVKWQIDQPEHPVDLDDVATRYAGFFRLDPPPAAEAVGAPVVALEPIPPTAEAADEACVASDPPSVAIDWTALDPLLDPTDTALAAQEPPHRPLWIPAVLWLRLRASVRMLLLASRCDGRSITAGDAWRQAQLARPAYRTVLPAFLAACEALRE